VDLYCQLVAFRIDPVINPALFSRFHCPLKFAESSRVQHMHDSHQSSAVEDFFHSLQVFANLDTYPTLSIVPLFSPSKLLFGLVAQISPTDPRGPTSTCKSGRRLEEGQGLNVFWRSLTMFPHPNGS